MTRQALYILLVTLLTSGVSAAQEADDYDRPGPYVGMVGLGAIETFDVDGADFSNGGGFNLRGGYRIMEYMAAEMQFEYVDGFSDQGFDIDAWNLMWSLKGFLLTERWQPYGLFGIGVIEGEADGRGGFSNDEADFAVRLGGGLDFYLNENVILMSEIAWVKPTDDLDDFSYLTIGAGLQYRF